MVLGVQKAGLLLVVHGECKCRGSLLGRMHPTHRLISLKSFFFSFHLSLSLPLLSPERKTLTATSQCYINQEGKLTNVKTVTRFWSRLSSLIKEDSEGLGGVGAMAGIEGKTHPLKGSWLLSE